MSDPPTTHPSLLLRLRDARDDQAWSQFVDIYAPLVYGYARKHGLQDADAADVTQEVLRSVARSIDHGVALRGERNGVFAVRMFEKHNI